MNAPARSTRAAAPDQTAATPMPAARPGLILAATILASSLAFVDASVINVGLPALGRGFGAEAGGLAWVINGYLLPLSALLLLGGTAGDRFGRCRLLIAGSSLFALASLACALAPSLAVLLAGRFVQGIAAALLMPNSLAILGVSFTGAAKGRAVGLWAAAGAAAGALGPVMGGWLIDLGSWRLIFLVNLPFAFGAIGLAWYAVPADRRLGGKPLDATGGSLVTLGLGGLTWALTAGSGEAGWSAPVVTVLPAAIAALLLFVWVERRRGEGAMMPLAMFASRGFVGLTVLTLLLYGALGCLSVAMPYWLIQQAGYTATRAGASLLPLPIVLALLSPLFGGLAGRTGPRLLLVLGCLGIATGFALTLRIGASAPYWPEVFPALVVIAVGLSAAVAPLTAAVLSTVDNDHAGAASGINSAMARTGGLIATALLGGLLAARGPALLHGFRAAMAAGALACLGAALSAWLLLDAGHGGAGTRRT